ncbi:hypothetical protein RHRU231_450133 [Rhodococcus ruber]|uniref:Uncharacterized protein n=1 Tax=Rhodococcus ruber TaxID=1830 RepID=A0A098BMM3_9NOCA|nr:hypothetical protein RHRU231_450133 [Rhodococcus ruber]
MVCLGGVSGAGPNAGVFAVVGGHECVFVGASLVVVVGARAAELRGDGVAFGLFGVRLVADLPVPQIPAPQHSILIPLVLSAYCVGEWVTPHDESSPVYWSRSSYTGLGNDTRRCGYPRTDRHDTPHHCAVPPLTFGCHPGRIGLPPHFPAPRHPSHRILDTLHPATSLHRPCLSNLVMWLTVV